MIVLRRRARTLVFSLISVFMLSLGLIGASGIAQASPASAGGLAVGSKLTSEPSKPAMAQHGKLLSRVLVPAVFTKNANGTTSVRFSPQWWCGCYYLKNVAYSGKGYIYLGASRGSNPYTTTVAITINQTISNQWSATGGISAEGVSAGVGFSVTQSYSISQTGTATIPYGHTVELDAYAVYNVDTFQVWYNPVFGGDYQAGSGNAWDYSGVIEFDSWQVS